MLYVGIFLLILGFVMIGVGQLLGIIALALGIYVVFDVNKKIKKQAEERAAEANRVAEEQRRIIESARAAAKPVQKPDKTKKRETIRAAGISHYTDNVISLGFENDEYSYSKRQIIDEYLEDEEIWQYSFPEYKVDFVYEPENKYDSNAIAIYIKDKIIGYVERDKTDHIRDLLDSGKIQNVSCEIVGGKYKIYDSDEECINKGEINFGARITLETL